MRRGCCVLWRARDGDSTAVRARGLARRLRRLRYAERVRRGVGTTATRSGSERRGGSLGTADEAVLGNLILAAQTVGVIAYALTVPGIELGA